MGCFLEKRIVGELAEVATDRDRVSLHALEGELYIPEVRGPDVAALVVQDEYDVRERVADVAAHSLEQVESDVAVLLEEGDVGLEREREIARRVDDPHAELADPLHLSMKPDRQR